LKGQNEFNVVEVKNPKRLTDHIEFPPYAFLPGKKTHPNKSGGHSFGKKDPTPKPLELQDPFSSEEYLFSLDLYNYGYYWESHVGLEALWNAALRTGVMGDFLKSLIKLGAAGVKGRLQSEKAMVGHLERALELFNLVKEKENFVAGFNLDELILYTKSLQVESSFYMGKALQEDTVLFPPLVPKRDIL
jgi:hypothetical protein